MPKIIDPEHILVDGLPGIWSPIQGLLTKEEKAAELHLQATASLLHSVNITEATLRLLLNETEIERIFDPPEFYVPELQGEWDPDIVTFAFKRKFDLREETQERNYLYAEYYVQDLGYWGIEIEPENVSIKRL